jgi:hypothetical protein
MALWPIVLVGVGCMGPVWEVLGSLPMWFPPHHHLYLFVWRCPTYLIYPPLLSLQQTEKHLLTFLLLSPLLRSFLPVTICQSFLFSLFFRGDRQIDTWRGTLTPSMFLQIKLHNNLRQWKGRNRSLICRLL